jgi:hypothetical protein
MELEGLISRTFLKRKAINKEYELLEQTTLQHRDNSRSGCGIKHWNKIRLNAVLDQDQSYASTLN